jgi:hypothetical protein
MAIPVQDPVTAEMPLIFRSPDAPVRLVASSPDGTIPASTT